MTNEFCIPPEEKVYRAFLSWLEEGKKLWVTFEQEGIPVPATLKRTLSDINQGVAKNQVRKTPVRQPDKPEIPPSASDNWFWVEAKETMLRTIVLALLNANAGEAMPIKEIIKRTKDILPSINEGSIYNIGAQEPKIQKAERGWKLREGVKAPVLYKGYIWAPKELLMNQDLAAFRRMAVRHLLATSQDGLQLMQVYRQLKEASWLNTPLSKDLVKADLLVMKKEKKVKLLGNSKKWTLQGNFG